MSDKFKISVQMADEKLKFLGKAGNHPDIVIDFAPPLGEGKGYNSMELLLVSLASCSGATALSILRKMKKTILGFTIQATGTKREKHPSVFEVIHMEFILESPDIQDQELEKVLLSTEQKYCPVWAMLKNSVPIHSKYSIIRKG